MCGEAFPAQARDIKLSTWNLDWLSLKQTGDPALPDDVHGRKPNDFIRLHHYATHLNADIIAFQEVDGPEPAARVFDPQTYQIILSQAPVIQRVGLAVKRPFNVKVNEELSALDVTGPEASHHLRTGLDVTVSDGTSHLRILVVHLKTGCWDQPLTQRKHSCPTLYQQFQILEDWIAERQDEGEPYAILGDFNRRLTLHDPLMQQIEHDAPVLLTTAGKASPCWSGEYFIDHIMLGNDARSWLIPDSLRVMTYRNDTLPDGLSDHCPVSVRLHLP
ncbi:hypothetical protein GFGA_1d0180 [Gluconobacter frateurii NBRC 103465]|nr:hypothetical protein GFGA_1d0180 [Gluconobacter frateurii NBRC 103465]